MPAEDALERQINAALEEVRVSEEEANRLLEQIRSVNDDEEPEAIEIVILADTIGKHAVSLMKLQGVLLALAKEVL